MKRPGTPGVRREVREEEGEADGLVGILGDDRVRQWAWPEEGRCQGRLGHHADVGLPFVDRHVVDQPQRIGAPAPRPPGSSHQLIQASRS